MPKIFHLDYTYTCSITVCPPYPVHNLTSAFSAFFNIPLTFSERRLV